MDFLKYINGFLENFPVLVWSCMHIFRSACKHVVFCLVVCIVLFSYSTCIYTGGGEGGPAKGETPYSNTLKVKTK